MYSDAFECHCSKSVPLACPAYCFRQQRSITTAIVVMCAEELAVCVCCWLIVSLTKCVCVCVYMCVRVVPMFVCSEGTLSRRLGQDVITLKVDWSFALAPM